MPATEPIEHVVPITKGKSDTDAEKVTLTQNHTATAEKSPDWTLATGVQTAFAAWNTGATSLATNGALVNSLRSQLLTAETTQKALRLAWMAQTRAVLIAVALYCAGVAKTMVSLGFGTRTFGRLGPLPAVDGLLTKLGKVPGETIIQWARGDANHGFLVQHATDVTNPATYSTPQPCTKTKIPLDGLVSGSIVNARVCAIDPTQKSGQAPWSAWIAATVK
jgi:hypothetical protein